MLGLSRMRYRFGPYELDPAGFELRAQGVAVPVEPQVLALLLYLAANRDRMVSKDDLIENVWQGRIISDAAIASRIKSARQSVGDNGTAQQVIRTVHGRGFRFVAALSEAASGPVLAAAPAAAPAAGAARPAIAVLPFADAGDLDTLRIVAQALPQEIINELARLRWLLVIARASSFRFAAANPDVRHIGEALGVGYVLHGSLRLAGGRLVADVELADTRDASLVWSEHFEAPVDGIQFLHSAIVARVVSALEVHVPLHEAERARQSTADTLEAWSAYHLGLQRMFRFTAADNAAAGGLFAHAIAREPGFARAHAGLSFVRFQDAFLDYGDAATAAGAARAAAERAVQLDPLDPFANASMGRAHWLSGDLDAGLGWLDRATTLSPNYAQGVYARAWTHSLLGHGAEGQRHVDQAMLLSPLDPLRYAMLATRALSHLVRGEYEEAAHWGERGAREPGAHALIAVIASACHALNGDDRRARAWSADAQKRQPSVSCQRFFQSFPFDDPGLRQQIAGALQRSGLAPG
jgi:TolB-like protein/tetratricopeptide (TPR) repeat protein